MAKLALVYGMRLFPAEDLGEVSEAVITLKDGRTSRVTMHLIEGSKEQIEKTLRAIGRGVFRDVSGDLSKTGFSLLVFRSGADSANNIGKQTGCPSQHSG